MNCKLKLIEQSGKFYLYKCEICGDITKGIMSDPAKVHRRCRVEGEQVTIINGCCGEKTVLEKVTEKIISYVKPN